MKSSLRLNCNEVPQWERCEDFNDDGFARVKGGMFGLLEEAPGCVLLWPEYGEIRLETDLVALVKSKYGLWGAYCLGYWGRIPADINCAWDGIWYEDGFYTVLRRIENDGEKYALLNWDKPFIDDLTERPIRYVPEHWTDYEGEVRFASYYIIRRGDNLGLVRGLCTTGGGGTVMQEPTIIKHAVYTYNHLCRMVIRDMRETEIAHYARLMSRIPKRSPVSDSDGWDSVPETLQEKIREHMARNDMKQPETVDELKAMDGY